MLTFVDRLPNHTGEPPLPHDLLTAWSLDPTVVIPLAIASIVYWRGSRPAADGVVRTWAWWLGCVVVAIALLSPIDAVAAVLLSVHMVQHVMLVGVGAPLLAFSSPGAALLRGSPRRFRRWQASTRVALGIDVDLIRRLRSPATRWLLFVGTLWIWHASVLYGAAVESTWIHALEHATFLGSAWLLWSVIIGPRRARLDRGPAVFAVFLLSLQSVLLSMLMTFARTPWYAPYAAPAAGWNIDPLADQQLAGVIMWVPSGVILTAIGLGLFVSWLHEIDTSTQGIPAHGSSRATTGTPTQ